MKKIKIAFCVRDMKIGGVESVMIRTMEKLLENKNLEIVVITYSKIKEKVYLDWFAGHPDVKLFTLYPSSWLGTDLPHFFLWRLFKHACRDVYRYVRRNFINFHYDNDIDVFIDYYNFSFNAEFRKLQKTKLIWWHSSIDNFIRGNYIKYMKNYDKLITLTDGFVTEFKKIYPEYSNKIIRIYNPIDINHVIQKVKNVTIPKGRYFCCVSRLYADKDISTLLKGFDIFWNKNDRPDVKLYIIGDGSYRIRYEEMSKSLSASKQIIFTGALSNPFGYMRGSMANILSSRREGLPTVLIEAAAVDTLNISSDCKNGPNEILYEGKGGLLFEAGDAKALAECMDAVFNKKVPINKMKQIAHNGLKRFDAGQISKQIIKLIKSYV